MADYAPPAGPPPPKVPAGWLAKWNEQYQEWFYVNMYTRRSQWEKPNEPVYPPDPDSADGAPPGPPPGYDPAGAQPVSDAKTGASRLSSNNPYGGSAAYGSPSSPAPGGVAQPQHPAQPDTSEDEQFARQLQAEEDARAAQRADRGASESYYGQAQGQAGTATTTGASYDDQPLPPRPEGKSRGLFGKLLGKGSKPANDQHQPYYGGPPPQPAYPGAAPYPAQQPYGGYGGAPGGYYGGGPGYGGPPVGYGYGRPGYGGYGGPPQRSHHMGTGGAAALGAGGGLLGGLLLADAFENAGDGGDDGGGGGDDGGGGDGGGGDGGGGD